MKKWVFPSILGMLLYVSISGTCRNQRLNIAVDSLCARVKKDSTMIATQRKYAANADAMIVMLLGRLECCETMLSVCRYGEIKGDNIDGK